jgi:hypothetical protein
MSKVRSVKRQIDAKRQEKAKAKRDRRQGGTRPEGEVEESAEALAPLTEAEFLAALQDATARFEAGELDFDEFDETKNELFARMQS